MKDMTIPPLSGGGSKEPSSHFVLNSLVDVEVTDFSPADPLAPRHPADTWFLALPGYRAACMMVTSPTSQGSSNGSPGGCWTEHMEDHLYKEEVGLTFQRQPPGELAELQVPVSEKGAGKASVLCLPSSSRL